MGYGNNEHVVVQTDYGLKQKIDEQATLLEQNVSLCVTVCIDK
jgi:hypothetical protein